MKDKIVLIYKSILAGAAISLGGIANICSQNKIIGSLFFCIGLFLVLTCDLNLFTGKICYTLDKKASYLFDLLLIYIGNCLGCMLCGTTLGSLTKYTDLATNYVEGLAIRMHSPWWQLIILGIFCNIMIYIAVEGYKKQDKEWKKALSLIFGVSVFVLCGFEHCVADMFYLSFCGVWSAQGVFFIIYVTLGNVIGGLLIPLCNKLLKTNAKLNT